MQEPRIIGIVITCTLIGAAVGGLGPSTGKYWENFYPMAGALIGAFVGIAVDLVRNGLPRRSDWRFSLRTLMLAIVAFAILSIGVNAFLQLLSFKP